MQNIKQKQSYFDFDFSSKMWLRQGKLFQKCQKVYHRQQVISFPVLKKLMFCSTCQCSSVLEESLDILTLAVSADIQISFKQLLSPEILLHKINGALFLKTPEKTLLQTQLLFLQSNFVDSLIWVVNQLTIRISSVVSVVP